MFPLLLALSMAPGQPQPVPIPTIPPEAESRSVPTTPPTAPPLTKLASGQPTCPSCPMWERYTSATSDCLGAPRYPFLLQPSVCPVGVADCPQVMGTATGTADKKCCVWRKEFHCPAYIAYPRFDEDGKPVPGDGLVIYEGMRLTVDPDTGNYELSFTATVPHMPVNLRLQLEFTLFETIPAIGQSVKVPKDWRTLTLPPIRMEPRRDAPPGDPAYWTFHVTHRGYSSSFLREEKCRPLNLADCNNARNITCEWELKRTGTARFGTPVAIEDPNR